MYQDYPIHLSVFHETLRLWPGVPKNARVAMKDDVIPALPGGEHGPIIVHKGDYVLWSDYAMMRNEKVQWNLGPPQMYIRLTPLCITSLGVGP